MKKRGRKSKRRELIKLRKQRGWTQEETVKQLLLNEGVEISSSYYSQIERKEKNPSLEVAQAISRLFNKTIEEVFFK